MANCCKAMYKLASYIASYQLGNETLVQLIFKCLVANAVLVYIAI